MKTKTSSLLLLSAFTLLAAFLSAQVQTPTFIKYYYDESGNRVKREKVTEQGNQQFKQGNSNDSTIAAVNSQEFNESKTSKNKDKNKGQNNNDINDESSLIIEVNPNPSSGKFAVFVESSDLEQPQSIEVYNTLGEIIYRSRGTFANQHNIDISRHPKGVYFIKLYDGDNIVVEKVVYQ